MDCFSAIAAALKSGPGLGLLDLELVPAPGGRREILTVACDIDRGSSEEDPEDGGKRADEGLYSPREGLDSFLMSVSLSEAELD